MTEERRKLVEAWEYFKTRISLVLRGTPCRDFDEAMCAVESAYDAAHSEEEGE